MRSADNRAQERQRPEPNKATVAVFLARWLAHIKTQVSPKTHERYSGIINQNVIPALGAVRLNKLKPVQISEARWPARW
jgi:hypothetical protein